MRTQCKTHSLAIAILALLIPAESNSQFVDHALDSTVSITQSRGSTQFLLPRFNPAFGIPTNLTLEFAYEINQASVPLVTACDPQHHPGSGAYQAVFATTTTLNVSHTPDFNTNKDFTYTQIFNCLPVGGGGGAQSMLPISQPSAAEILIGIPLSTGSDYIGTGDVPLDASWTTEPDIFPNGTYAATLRAVATYFFIDRIFVDEFDGL